MSHKRELILTVLLILAPNKDILFSIDDLSIPWNELVLKEKIGAGIKSD
jgi:hypothetical protein